MIGQNYRLENHGASLFKHISGYTKERKMPANSHHGFIRDKSCLISLTSFYDKLSYFWTRRTLYVIHIDFSKAFDIVSHNLVSHKLASKGLGW